MEQFRDTIATRKIFQLKKRIRAVAGGTWASKTISILVWLIDYAQSQKNKDITVVAESVPHLDLGAIKDFKNILLANGYWNDNSWNGSSRTYTFPTGSAIKFVSFDKFGKAHGPRRDVLFINEANNIPFNIADQLITRTRETIWLDWNPSEEFWFYTEMQGKRKDIDFLTLTYQDVKDPDTKEWILDQTAIDEIESHKDNKAWWQVYGLGQLGEITSRIFTGWQIIDEIPFEARLERRWLDFGYTNDPTAIGDLYYYNGGYILDETLYQKGLSNKKIADVLLGQTEQALVVADSAEPKSIAEIKDYGVTIVGAEKHSGETKNIRYIKWSIGVVQGEKVSVTRRSFNILKEQRNYLWLVDKNGVIQNVEDPKCANHHMRGIAYAICNLKPIKSKQELRRQLGQQWINKPQTNPV